MNFKSKYKEYNESIVPDGKFINELADKMDCARTSQNKKITINKYVIYTAALFIIAGGLFFTLDRNNYLSEDMPIYEESSESNRFELKGGNVTEDKGITEKNYFSDNNWYNENTETADLPKVLASRLYDNTDMDKLYVSEEEVFDDMIASEEEIKELSSLVNLAEVADESEEPVSPVYYMAVFKNGDIVKFTVWNNCFITINGVNALYIIK